MQRARNRTVAVAALMTGEIQALEEIAEAADKFQEAEGAGVPQAAEAVVAVVVVDVGANLDGIL